MSSTTEYRAVGWDPFTPGSIVFMAANHWSTTRDPGRAAIFPTLHEAEEAAVNACREQVGSLTSWRPVRGAPDLRELQQSWRTPRGDIGSDNSVGPRTVTRRRS